MDCEDRDLLVSLVSFKSQVEPEYSGQWGNDGRGHGGAGRSSGLYDVDGYCSCGRDPASSVSSRGSTASGGKANKMYVYGGIKPKNVRDRFKLL